MDCEDDIYAADQITIEVCDLDSDSNDSQSADGTKNNVLVVRKPQLIKYKTSRGYREIIKIKQNKEQSQLRKLDRKSKSSATKAPQLMAMQRVVTDVCETESKLKRPGPFQAANRTYCAVPSVKSVGSLNCSYCQVVLITQLEKELHVVAQHKHEITNQQQPLQCLQSGCVEQCPSVVELKRHLTSAHGIEMTSKFFTFHDNDEFLTWKQELDTASGTRFMVFSSFGEVTGGNTRVYVCNNEGQYDHRYVKVGLKRRTRKIPSNIKKKGRACTAQLLVRSWGWGAIEVEAMLCHYGHLRDGVLHGLEQTISSCPKADPTVGITSNAVVAEPQREDGVRIIEGSMLGQRGMDDLQADLARWRLYDNISICLCKRRYELDSRGILKYDDFVLGFSSSDQLDIWSQHGARAVCLDVSEVSLPDTEGGTQSTRLVLCTVLVMDNHSRAIPVSWLLSSEYSDTLLRHFVLSLKTAYESFHHCLPAEPQYLIAEADCPLYRTWQEVFQCSPTVLLVPWTTHKTCLAHLHMMAEDVRRPIFSKLTVAARTSDPTTAITAVLEALTQHQDTQQYAAAILEYWLPQLQTRKQPVTHNNYNTNIYFDILHSLFTFIYVEDNFTTNYDDCVAKLSNYASIAIDQSENTDAMVDSSERSVTGGSGCHSSSNNSDLCTSGDVTDNSSSLCRWAQLIEDRHNEARSLGAENVAPLSQHSWRVRCHKMSGVWHTVKRQECKTSLGALKSMCDSSCKQVCWLCELCVHQYSCSCPDSIVLSTICVHMHLIRIFVLNPYHVPTVDTKNLDTPTNTKSFILSKTVVCHNNKDTINLSIQNKCSSLMSVLKTSSNKVNWTPECLSHCELQLDTMLAMLQSTGGCSTTTPPLEEEQGGGLYHLAADTSSGTVPDTTSDASAVDVYYASDGRALAVGGDGDRQRVLGYGLDEDELQGGQGLMMLQEEDGRYRFVSSSCNSELLEPRKDTTLLYHSSDEASRHSPIEGQAAATTGAVQ